MTRDHLAPHSCDEMLIMGSDPQQFSPDGGQEASGSCLHFPAIQSFVPILGL